MPSDGLRACATRPSLAADNVPYASTEGTYPRIAMSRPWRIGSKVLLAASTLLAILSYGGLLIFLFLPLGVGMWWAVRHSRRIERVAWVALAGLAGAEWAWQITYPITEGNSPSVLIIAVVGGVATATLLTLGSHYALTRDVRPRSSRALS